jgi:hypothetical protein
MEIVTMCTSRTFFASLALVFAAGCGTGPAADSDDFSGLNEKSDSFSYRMNLVGSLKYGQSLDVAYHNPPRFAAVAFDGNEGDKVAITVDSSDGSSILWVLDSSFNVLTRSADQDPGVNHTELTLPKSDSSKHYLVLRDATLSNATFTVDLEGVAKPADYFSCNVDADCVAVAEAACCQHGRKAAVNKDEVDAYEGSVSCTGHEICPQFVVLDKRVAECNTGTQKCEMVMPEDIVCGGFTRNPHACAAGYTCDHTGLNPDVPGVCKQDSTTGKTCGGLAGLTCDAGFECVYGAGCDPNNGGADCSGVCQPSAGDCNGQTCGAGEYCSFCWGGLACIPKGALC